MSKLRFGLAGATIAMVAAACGSSNPGFTGDDSEAGAGGDGSAGDGGGDGSSSRDGGTDGAKPGDATSGTDATSTVDAGIDAPIDAPPDVPCNSLCSGDLQSVVDCNGFTVQVCAAGQECDLKAPACVSACKAAIDNRQSSGCDYYATDMDIAGVDLCYAAFVANTWTSPAHVQVEYAGAPIDLAKFAKIPSGAGPTLTYGAYDPVAGIPPKEMIIVFLAGSPSSMVPCPVPAAIPTGANILNATGVGHSFHISSDVPVASYQINPYGGGSAAVTGASLLLPTSAWDTSYLGLTVTPNDVYPPSMNIVAAQDATQVTMTPVVAVTGGGALPAGAANVPYTFTLNKGEQAQFTQPADLSGSRITSTKPIGFMAGQACMRAPFGVAYCDHGEQMIPPIAALGTEYVGVMYRPRVAGDKAIWHLVGAADGTQLTWSSPVGGPATVNAGQAVDFITDQPFVVTSQDAFHPFVLGTYMSGSQWGMLSNTSGYGDADFVLGVPPSQYLSEYVFFADPTYPETSLVLVRQMNGAVFEDVTLDCLGTVTGWQPVGAYEWARVDLISHNFVNQGNCSTGRHEIKSKGKLGLWVWGWGSPETTSFTANVSYGYPGGMNVQKVNRLGDPTMP